jgi:hypothetical protein
MKKKLNGVASAILKVVSVIFLTALFIAVVLFALTQSFGVGLVIILGALIVHFLLGYNYPKSFFWGEYRGLSLAGYSNKEKFSKTLNIVFNLVKVLTALSVFRLIYINYSETLNHFGGIAITLIVVLAVILILIMSLNRDERDYRLVRGSLAVLVGLVIISFACMTFGTQLIWIPFVVSLIFGLMFGAFNEIGEIFLGKKKGDHIAISLLIILFLVSIVSTVIQFWSSIVSFFVNVWTIIVAIFSFKLIAGLPLWSVFLIIIALATLYYISLYLIRKSNTKKQLLANEAKKAEEKRLKAEKEAEEKKNKDLAIENKWKEINALAISLKEKTATVDDLIFIARTCVVDRFDCLHKFSVKSLTAVSLDNLYIISDVKKQIVWKQDFLNILCLYSDLYGKNYQDEDLKSIITVFDSSLKHLSKYQDYDGYKGIIKKISETGIPASKE